MQRLMTLVIALLLIASVVAGAGRPALASQSVASGYAISQQENPLTWAIYGGIIGWIVTKICDTVWDSVKTHGVHGYQGVMNQKYGPDYTPTLLPLGRY